MTYDLKFTDAALRTRQHTMATQNEGVTQAIGRETVFLGILTIYVSTVYLPTFSNANSIFLLNVHVYMKLENNASE